jgi:hypothetical protein
MSPALRHNLFALAAGLAVALGVWLALPNSAPPSQALALCEAKGLLVIAEPGPGFYGVERKSGRRWSWSGGEGALTLRRLDQPAALRPVHLRFNLHCLKPREITVSYGKFVLWKGRLQKAFVPVDIPVFTMTGPLAEISLKSDLPGELIAGGGDLRPLAFAVYDLEITPAD